MTGGSYPSSRSWHAARIATWWDGVTQDYWNRGIGFPKAPGGTHQLRGEHGEELALGHAVPEHDQPLRLPPVVLLVELEEERLGDGPHVLDHLLVPVQPRVLDPHLVQVVLRQVQVVHVEMV